MSGNMDRGKRGYRQNCGRNAAKDQSVPQVTQKEPSAQTLKLRVSIPTRPQCAL